jgi:hypothetical protein
MTSGDVAIELAAEVGQTLPAAYLAFLDGLPARPRVFESDSGPILDFGGRHWRPHTREAMTKPVRFNRGSTFPRAHEMAAIAEDLHAGDEARRAEMTEALTEQRFTVERLARGFCIGDDGMGSQSSWTPRQGQCSPTTTMEWTSSSGQTRSTSSSQSHRIGRVTKATSRISLHRRKRHFEFDI